MRVLFASKHIKSIRMRVVLAQSIATAQEDDENEKTVDTKKKRICMRCCWRWWEMGWRSGDEKIADFFSEKFFSFYFLQSKQTTSFSLVLFFFSLLHFLKYFSAANCRNQQRRHFTKDEENLKCSVWLCQSVEREQSEVVAAKSALKRMPHSPCTSFTL